MTEQRIDITIWPETGEMVAHKHATEDGSDCPTPLGSTEVNLNAVKKVEALAAILRIVWPDVRATWEQLGAVDTHEIVSQMVADGTLDRGDGDLLLWALRERW